MIAIAIHGMKGWCSWLEALQFLQEFFCGHFGHPPRSDITSYHQELQFKHCNSYLRRVARECTPVDRMYNITQQCLSPLDSTKTTPRCLLIEIIHLAASRASSFLLPDESSQPARQYCPNLVNLTPKVSKIRTPSNVIRWVLQILFGRIRWETLCSPTLWKWESSGYTGLRWNYPQWLLFCRKWDSSSSEITVYLV